MTVCIPDGKHIRANVLPPLLLHPTSMSIILRSKLDDTNRVDDDPPLPDSTHSDVMGNECSLHV